MWLSRVIAWLQYVTDVLDALWIGVWCCSLVAYLYVKLLLEVIQFEVYTYTHKCRPNSLQN